MKQLGKAIWIVVFLLGTHFQTNAQISEGSFNEEVSRNVSLNYLLYKPENYKNTSEKFPLIVFLHGAGERGDNLDKVKIQGPLKYIEEGNTINAVVLAPQCPDSIYWQPHDVAALIKKTISTEKIDTDRVYITGLSMGGYGTWATAVEYPELFAAAVPVCGAIYRPAYRNPVHLKEMPIWVFHGALDDVVYIENSNKMVMALKQAGNEKVKYTVYPFANHNSWSETYSNPEMYKWMLKQTKK